MIATLFIIIGTIGGLISVLFPYYIWLKVKKLSTGEGRVKEIYNHIRIGAKAYLKREFKTITIIAIILTIIIWLGLGSWVALSYVVGTITSLAASFIGMDLATHTNVRVTLAAKEGLLPSMRIAFQGGTIMGLLVFGVNVLQIVLLFSILHWVVGLDYMPVMIAIAGCGFGSSFTSVILQLGGGIYTKGADIGADIVGKVEAGIPEDDYRNPAVIADAVGDNVGDCAGRSADLYETLTSQIISSMILGITIFLLAPSLTEMVIFFPFIIRTIAAVATVGGYYFVVKTKKGEDPWKILSRGLFLTSFIIGIVYAVLIIIIFNSISLMIAAIIGVIINLIMGNIVQHYTGFKSKAVEEISKGSETGAETNIINGLSNGMRAVFIPLSVITICILAAYGCGILWGIPLGFNNVTSGIYGIVIMSIGMTSGTGIILSMDGFGPIADNAGGIAEMANMEPEIRNTMDKLDATGNSTKSLTKGFSILTGTFIGFTTIFAFLTILQNQLGLSELPLINIGDPRIAIGGILGVITVFLFVSLLLKAVGSTASTIIEEVRHQFNTRPGILEGTMLPDYARCVDISTVSALKNMIFPSILIIVMPIIVGFILGPYTLGAYLIIATFVGGGMGLFLNISGASWDNAKKLRKTLRDKTKPGTIEAYKNAVIGDTVGDPCKDTAGSSLGSFVTTINNMALTFLPLFIQFSLIFIILGIY
ncbi:MAG: sodium-translocating pyrophosphatase [Promethearchaeota archaeon]